MTMPPTAQDLLALLPVHEAPKLHAILPAAGEPLNWLGLAFSASTAARAGATADRAAEARAWANVALTVYEHLGDPQSQLNAMMLRAYLIRALGPQSGDALLDPERIMSWFRASVVGTTAESAAAASATTKSQLRSGPRDEAAERRLLETLTPLRQIKNRLGVIELLAQRPEVVLPADLRAWLDVRSVLV
jgi:hypothetical protein